MQEKTELDKLEKMPKVVLHLHLDGSLRPSTVYKWLKQQGEEVNLEKVEKDLMVSKDCRDLNEYLQKFDLPLKVLQSEENIEQATYELFEDLAKQNVIYGEVRFAPSLHTKKGLEYSKIVEAAIKGMENAKEKYKIEGNLLLCCMRGENNKKSNLKTVEMAKEYLNKGVCGLDLAGAEALYPTSKFTDVFKMAKDLNIPFTIHAGEAARARKYKNCFKNGSKENRTWC